MSVYLSVYPIVSLRPIAALRADFLAWPVCLLPFDMRAFPLFVYVSLAVSLFLSLSPPPSLPLPLFLLLSPLCLSLNWNCFTRILCPHFVVSIVVSVVVAFVVISCCYLHFFLGCNFQCGSVNRPVLRGISRGSPWSAGWRGGWGRQTESGPAYCSCFDCDAQMSAAGCQQVCQLACRTIYEELKLQEYTWVYIGDL